MASSLSSPTVDAWWVALKEDGDQDAHARLVLHYTPLVKYVVGRIRPSLPAHVDQGDLLSDGVMGLLDAMEKFDHTLGLQFQTYAALRIRGAVMDGLRASDWVPRNVREKLRELEIAQRELESRHGRTATDHEIATELEISVAELHELYRFTSYTNIVSAEAMELHEGPPPRSTIDAADLNDDLPAGFLHAVRRLPERDQIVVALYYWEHLTLAEIGQVLGVSESRVSQLHSRATLTLRRLLSDVPA